MKGWPKVLLGVSVFLAVGLLALVSLAWLIIGSENWNKRKVRFERAAENGMVVVDAITKYETQHGTPPPSLEALVPEYLKAIPDTGLRDYPSYEYSVFTNTKSSLVWYDLGSRQGKPMSGLWVYVDGQPEHAILALTLDQNDRITEAHVDRMPEEYERIEFDAAKWKWAESRIEMVRSLPSHIPLKDRPFAEVQESLGVPSGRRVLLNSPWELRIKCSRGILNWDIFFYWPTRDYPESIYGGATERIGHWAYVHE